MKNLLIVVDMQKDFVDGNLGTKEAVAIVSSVLVLWFSQPLNTYTYLNQLIFASASA